MEMSSARFIELVEPVLRTVFDGSYQAKEPQWPKLFAKSQGQKARFQESTMLYGFGLPVETAEGAPVSRDQAGVSWTVRMTFRKYSLSYSLTEELLEDSNAIDVASAMAKHLGTSMREGQEVIHADVFNRCEDTSFLGGDGQTLLSVNHPKAVGGVWSNRLADPADLSEASLEALLIMIDTAVDDRGNKIELTPMKVVVPPQQRFNAIRILRSSLQSGTSNNDVNAIRSEDALPSTPMILNRLTLSKSYFVTTNVPNGLKHYSRYDMRKKMEGEFSTGNMRFKAAMRFVCGWEDPRCVFGSKGV